MEDGLVLIVYNNNLNIINMVLILVVMEDGLVPDGYVDAKRFGCLNPCCNGRWSRTSNIRF